MWPRDHKVRSKLTPWFSFDWLCLLILVVALLQTYSPRVGNTAHRVILQSLIRYSGVLHCFPIMTFVVYWCFYILWWGSLTRINVQTQCEVEQPCSCLNSLTSFQFQMALLISNSAHYVQPLPPLLVSSLYFFFLAALLPGLTNLSSVKKYIACVFL